MSISWIIRSSTTTSGCTCRIERPASAALSASVTSTGTLRTDIRRTISAYVEYFNKHFQLYGRQVRIQYYKGQGDLISEFFGGGSEGANAGDLDNDGVKDIIAGPIKAAGNTSVKGGNRLSLLRDADGDGTYELQSVFAENLNAPYGLALIDNALYVANQDALVRFEYRDGQTGASGPPVTVTELPSAINHHWTKSLAASPDGGKPTLVGFDQDIPPGTRVR